MGFIKTIAYCPSCNADVMFVRFVCPLWVHVAVTAASLGVWLLAAPLARLHRSQWRCSHCGGRPVGRPFPPGQPRHYLRLRPQDESVNQLLIGHNLVYYLPTNAAFSNTDHR